MAGEFYGIERVQCGDEVLLDGVPFGQAHHWIEGGVSVRLLAPLGAPGGVNRDGLVVPPLTASHVELTAVTLADNPTRFSFRRPAARGAA